jgi:hypothetical protein
MESRALTTSCPSLTGIDPGTPEVETRRGKDDYEAEQVEVQRLSASGILAHARGNDRTGARGGRGSSARELLADLLLELDDSAAALKEYEQSPRTGRNRFRSILEIEAGLSRIGIAGEGAERSEAVEGPQLSSLKNSTALPAQILRLSSSGMSA